MCDDNVVRPDFGRKKETPKPVNLADCVNGPKALPGRNADDTVSIDRVENGVVIYPGGDVGRHGSGKCECARCAHEWTASFPLPMPEPASLQCPKCRTYRGFVKRPFGPAEGAAVFACGTCGSTQFFVAAEGATEDDIPLINTSGGQAFDHYLICSGCGEKAKF